MKLKYYLRGLGIGIVVTALLMGFVKGGGKESLSDEEIIARAEALGMVQSGVLSDDLGSEAQETADREDTDISFNQLPDTDTTDIEADDADASADPATETADADMAGTEEATDADAAEETTDVKTEETSGVDTVDADSKTDAAKGTDQPTEDSKAEETVSFNINSGDGSDTVARRLATLGVIADAADFDRYLCQNGYDKKIAAGSHEIQIGADYHEIAEALIKRK